MNNITILSLGAGVQSTVLALMACRGELSPEPQHIMFADTGDETHATYEHLEWIKAEIKKAGIPLHIVTGGNIRKDVSAALKDSTLKGIGQPPFFVKNGRLDESDERGRLMRRCTDHYKIRPMRKAVRKILGLKKGKHFPRDTKVIKLLGISMDEVIRMKPSRDSWEEIQWPLIEMGMTRWDCYIWLKDKNYPIPPSSSCIICPFHRNKYWRALKIESPVEFEEVCIFDDSLREGKIPGVRGDVYIHDSCLPLRSVDFSDDVDRGQAELDLWGGECDGICGT